MTDWVDGVLTDLTAKDAEGERGIFFTVLCIYLLGMYSLILNNDESLNPD